MSELTERIEKLKKSPLYQCEIVALLTDCQSEIERLERENAQLKDSQTKQFDYSYKLTVERQGLERQLEAAETALRYIREANTIQTDALILRRWAADYFAQSQKSHHENCDIYDTAPEFGPEHRKPCNCYVAEIERLERQLEAAENVLNAQRGHHAHFCRLCSLRKHNGWWSHNEPCNHDATEWRCKEHRNEH